MMMLFGFEVTTMMVCHCAVGLIVGTFQVDTLEISLKEQLDLVDRCQVLRLDKFFGALDFSKMI